MRAIDFPKLQSEQMNPNQRARVELVFGAKRR
jgi:hypothetical protein